LEKGTFISSLSPYPEEEYFLGKSTWSVTASDWKQRFEVGDVVADPSGSWKPSTAQQYIDQQVATITGNLANETIARQTTDQSLQNQINSEATTRANVDTSLQNQISTEANTRSTVDEQLRILYENLTQSDIVVGPRPSSGQLTNVIYREPDQSHTPPQNYSDYMWYNNEWVLMATYDNAIDDVPTAGSENLVKSGGVYDYNLVKKVKLVNLADYINMNDKTYINVSGVETATNTYGCTPYLRLSDGITSITYSNTFFNRGSNILILAFYRKDKTFISGVNAATNMDSDGYCSGTVTVPQNTYYVRFGANTETFATRKAYAVTSIIEETSVTEYVSRIVEDKLVYSCFGDSISSDITTSDYLSYPRILEKLCNLELDRYTVSGTGVSLLKSNIAKSKANASLVTIMYGINDLQRMELGDIDTILAASLDSLASNTTFFGMYRYSVETLRNRLTNPNALIVCISPIRQRVYDGAHAPDWDAPAEKLNNMRAGIEKIVTHNGGANSGWFYINSLDLLQDGDLYYYDSTHPNVYGEAILAKNIFNRLPDIKLFVTRK